MKYTTLIRASATYDLLLTAPLAVPGLAELTIGLLGTVNQSLGGEAFPPLTPIPLLFAHLLGSIVTVWSVLRLLQPRWELGLADAVARVLFTAHFAGVLAQGGYPLGWFLLVPEALWGLAQAVGGGLYLRNAPQPDSQAHT